MNFQLKRFFEDKGITAKMLAESLEMTTKQAESLISGRNKFLYKNAIAVGRKFHISPAWLMTGEGSPDLADGVEILSREEIGARLSAFLKGNNLKYTDVAVLCGKAPETICSVVSGNRNVTAELASVLGKPLGISPNWLLTGEGEMMEGETPNFKEVLEDAYNSDGDTKSVVSKTAESVQLRKENSTLRKENTKLRSDVARLEAQVRQLLGMIDRLTSGKA